jgi:hypothetical protein
MRGSTWRRALWRIGAAILIAIVLQLASAHGAHASDARVWVNTNSGVYHCPGGEYYGNTKRGRYLSEADAIASGYRAAYNRPCDTTVARAARESLVQSFAPGNAADATTVWINTSSHVYHCPGTRYYGATKRGRYASEAEAIAGGNRPAYGAACP